MTVDGVGRRTINLSMNNFGQMVIQPMMQFVQVYRAMVYSEAAPIAKWAYCVTNPVVRDVIKASALSKPIGLAPQRYFWMVLMTSMRSTISWI